MIPTMETSQYEKFQERYWNDRAAFVRDCIDWDASPWDGMAPYQEEILSELDVRERVSVRGPHGLGKCIAFGEDILLASGEWVKAESLIGHEFDVPSVTKDMSATISRARAFDNGAREVAEVITEDGRRIVRTLNHPIWAGRWVLVGELSVGDEVAVNYGTFGKRLEIGRDWVKQVNRLGKQRTVGISVEGTHTFLTEFIEHNTAMAAWLVLHFALTLDGQDWKAPTLASVYRQLAEYLWPEIHKWSRWLRWDRIGRDAFNKSQLMVLRLRLKTGASFAAATKEAGRIEGAHADHMLYIFDESKSIADALWDAAEGAFSMGSPKWFAISTPGEAQGRFHQIQTRQRGYHDWWVRHVTMDEAVAAGRMRPKWVEDKKEQWGENSPIYQNRVLGEFADSPSDAIIPLSWVDAANERWREWDKEGTLTAIGVDVGGGLAAGNQSVMAKAYDRFKVAELVKVPMASDPQVATMELTGRIVAMLRGTEATAIVDSIGIGAGVVHRLRELEYEAIDFVAGRKTSLMDKVDSYGFRNWRSAAWWITRELLEPDSGYDVCLPPDDELTGDLTTPKWKPVSAGLIFVEPKEKVKARLPEGRSTDCGDAVVQVLVGKTLENARLLEEIKKKKPKVKSIWAPGYKIGQGLTRGRRKP